MDRNEQSAPFLPCFPGIIAAASNSKCKNPPLLIFHAVTAALAVGAPASMCGLLQRERKEAPTLLLLVRHANAALARD